MTNNDDATTTTNALSPPYPGALYGVLRVKFVPEPEPFLRRRRVPRVRAFCEKCRAPHWLTVRQLTRGACPACPN